MAQSNVFPAIIKAEYDPNGGFPKMVQDAQNASAQIKRQFENDFNQISNLAKEALAIPRNAGGSLDLNVGQYREAAAAAKAQAIALREVATAAEAAQRSNGDNSRATQLMVQAARAAAREAEDHARSVNDTAIAYERLQAELNRTKSQTDAVVASTGRGTTAFQANTQSVRAMRQATTQAGQQLQDIVISMGSGQRASTVLAQQLPQLAFAFSDVGGKVGAVARFLSGPWGVGVAIAAFALGPLIDNLFTAGNESDKLKDKSLSLREALDAVNYGTEQATKAIREYNDAQAAATKSSALEKEQLIAKADAYAATTIRIRENIVARIEALQLADRELRRSGDRGAFGFGAGADALSGDLAKAKQDVIDAQQALRNLRIERAEIGAKNANDPIAKINDQYDRMADAAKEAARGNDALTSSLEKQLTVIEGRRKAALDAERESSRSSTSSGLPKVTESEVARLLGFGPGQYGGRRSGARNKQVGGATNSYHLSGQAIDIPLTLNGRPLTKEGIRAELEAAGVIIKELLGPGDKDHDDHFHVAFSKTRGGPDQINRIREREAAAAARETERLARISDSAAEAVARVNEQFDEQPRLVDQSAQAVRRLQRILDEINEPKNAGTPRAAEIRRDAEEGIRKAQAAVDNDFNRQTENFKARLDIQKLILAGKIDEAAIAERIAAIEERYGTGKRLDELKRELDVANEILATEDATAEERAAAQDTIKSIGGEYDRLTVLANRIKNETTEQYELEQAINRALEKRSEILGRYQSVISGTYGALEDLLSGGSGGDFLKSIRKQFIDLRGANLAESLFGDAFRQLRLFTERNNPENVAVRNLVEQIDTGSTAIQEFAKVVTDATRMIDAANDNNSGFANADAGFGAGAAAYAAAQAGEGIVVTGQITKAIRDGNRLTYANFASQTAKSIINPLLDSLDKTFGVNFFTQLSGALSGALAGYARAGNVGGALGFGQGLFDTLSKNTKLSEKSAASLSKISSKFGQALGGSQTGDQTAQLLRSFGVKTSRTGGQIGGAIGSFLPIPGGEIIGSIIGSVVGGLFKKTKKGSTTISNLTDELAFTGSGKLKESTLGLGNNVKASLANIIEQLGGSAGQFSVSIGQRGKNFVVDPSGAGRTKGSGVLKFKTEEEAARAALLDAIKDGAVAGITAGAQRLLQAGKDLDAQLQKAMKFQSVFDRLRAIKDPIGAAVESLNREFNGLINIFKEAGASAQEFAQLEELYGLERAKIIKETSESLTGSLRQLISDLETGDNGLSLRDRLSNVRAQFDPLANDIRAGKTIDYDKFAEVARNLIDIQRQISGSQSDYFDVFNEILGLSKSALANQENIISIGTGGASPFGSGSVPSNDNTPIVNAIGSQTNALVASLAAVQAQIAALNFGPSRLATPSGFSIGGNTYF